jgi:hypothetical protein
MARYISLIRFADQSIRIKQQVGKSKNYEV